MPSLCDPKRNKHNHIHLLVTHHLAIGGNPIQRLNGYTKSEVGDLAPARTFSGLTERWVWVVDILFRFSRRKSFADVGPLRNRWHTLLGHTSQCFKAVFTCLLVYMGKISPSCSVVLASGSDSEDTSMTSGLESCWSGCWSGCDNGPGCGRKPPNYGPA